MPWQPVQLLWAMDLPSAISAAVDADGGLDSCFSPHPMPATNIVAASKIMIALIFNDRNFIEMYFEAMRFNEKRCM
ncbi:MAG: hypothetical protein LJE85_02645 [Gammaproteobacteria bacterium]|nr:hypothetical protein [Gammaproteobacteria bacterium]